MKRLLLILIAVVLLLTALGCTKKTESFSVPENFYYRRNSVAFHTDDAVIKPEIRETADCRDKILDTVNLYLQGPVSDKFVSPFPQGLTALSIEQIDDSLVLQLNDSFNNLNGLERTIACSCLFRTLTDLTGCNIVEIQFSSADRNGFDSIILSNDDLCFADAGSED